MTERSLTRPGTSWGRILEALRLRTAPRKPREIKIGSAIAEIAAQIRERQVPRFFGLLPEQAALVAQFYPDAYYATLESAGYLLDHKFSLPGAGRISLGASIPWHVDIKAGYTWPVEHTSRLAVYPESRTVDPSLPWELSRFYHLVRLGQAFLFTGNNQYAAEIVLQLRDWIKANPVEFGINWVRPVDVAIRAVNWIWAYYCILESDALTTDFLKLWLVNLREHASYLLKSLDRPEIEHSHLLASLAGLAYLGVMLPEFPEATRWRSVGLGRFWKALEEGVNPDGMLKTGSSYQLRFTIEMGLSIAALCLANGIDIPDTARARLFSMLDLFMLCLQPDGTLPAIGAAPPDRLLDLAIYPSADHDLSDGRGLLALGSLVLERQLNEWAGFIDVGLRGWSVVAGEQWQEAFWYFASDAAARLTDVITQTVKRPDDVKPDAWIDVRPGIRVQARALTPRPIILSDIAASRESEASGLYIMRHGHLHMLVNASTASRHNDLFSMTLWAYGGPLLIDPGTYAHAGQSGKGTLCWSTAAHNTLQVDGAELSPQAANGSPVARPHVKVHRWISQDAFDLLDVSHDAYSHLSPGIIHRRLIWFDKKAALWLVIDMLRAVSSAKGDLSVAVDLRYHLVPVELRLEQPAQVFFTKADGANLVITPLGRPLLEARLEQDWRASAGGAREQGPVARYSGMVKLPVELVTLLYPHGGAADLNVVRSAGRTSLQTLRQVIRR